jgi:hypothetical protein
MPQADLQRGQGGEQRGRQMQRAIGPDAILAGEQPVGTGVFEQGAKSGEFGAEAGERALRAGAGGEVEHVEGVGAGGDDAVEHRAGAITRVAALLPPNCTASPAEPLQVVWYTAQRDWDATQNRASADATAAHISCAF